MVKEFFVCVGLLLAIIGIGIGQLAAADAPFPHYAGDLFTYPSAGEQLETHLAVPAHVAHALSTAGN